MTKTSEEIISESDPTADDRYRTLFENSRDGIYLADGTGRILDANPAMTELFGYNRSELLGMASRLLYADPDHLLELQERMARGECPVRDVETRLLKKDGREITCLLTFVEDSSRDEAPGHQAILHDVTERLHVEERIQHAALHDSLTQLPNRTFFLDRLRRLLERLRFQPDYRFAVLFVDLDRFKLINDSLGHRAGDELLIMLAERLPMLVRPEDIVARFGGDEFTILLLDLDGQEDAELVANRVQNGLGEGTFDVLGHDVYVTASIGIALSSRDYDSAEDIIRDADTAMYAAKDSGRGRWTFFDETMHERAVMRFATETALQRALERDEFILHYQPLVVMETGEVVGFEALLRWDHPDRGMLPPAEFLAVAEETGLIIPIGQWVLEEACRTAAEWREGVDEEDAPVIAVNLSARQLMAPGLGDQVRAVLERTGLPGNALRLEITETVLLEDSAAVQRSLVDLDELGVWICLDDFGTGYSSLGYLKDLPVDLVKIDQAFIGGVSDPPGTSRSEMAEAIVSLAKQLGVGTVAEGVETEDQRDRLIRLGCGHAQGYLFSRPLAPEDARVYLDRARARRRSGRAESGTS
ncbi:MAG: putative bifunctional diguanylate cyclase/phosphodiesterase [Longimicrobiales bacterium]